MTFIETEWLDETRALYILCFSVPGIKSIPFYVGETGRHAGRPSSQRLNNFWKSSPGIESEWSRTSRPLSKSYEEARQSTTGAGFSTLKGMSARPATSSDRVGSKSTNSPCGAFVVIRQTRRAMIDFLRSIDTPI